MTSFVAFALLFLIGAVVAMIYARSGNRSARQKAVAELDGSLLPRDPSTGAFTQLSLNEHVAKRLKNADVEAALGGFALLLARFERSSLAERKAIRVIDEASLAQIVRCLNQALRSSDFLARVNDGQLVVVVPQVSDRATAARVAQKMIDSVRALGEKSQDHAGMATTTSIGISLFPGDAQDFAALLSCAEQARAHARREGEGRYSFNEIGNQA